MPLRKNPQTRTEPLLASITPTMPLRFEPPEKPAKATGHLADCGQSLRIASSPAPSIPRRHWVESSRGEIVASVPSTTQPSAFAGLRYHSASMMLVRLKSLVELTMRIGQEREGSKPGGDMRTARPVCTIGLPPCDSTLWKYFGTGN